MYHVGLHKDRHTMYILVQAQLLIEDGTQDSGLGTYPTLQEANSNEASRRNPHFPHTMSKINNCLLLTLLFLLPVVNVAFGNFPSQVNDLLTKLGPIKSSESVDPGVALLREMGITRTTPKPFQLRPDQLPDFLSASLLVRVGRCGSRLARAYTYTGAHLCCWSHSYALHVIGTLSIRFWCIRQWVPNILDSKESVGVHPLYDWRISAERNGAAGTNYTSRTLDSVRV